MEDEKERKVDGTTNKAFNKMPSPSLLEWAQHLKKWAHTKEARCRWAWGRKWRTLGKQPAAWSRLHGPRSSTKTFLTTVSFHHQHTLSLKSPEPLPVSRITEFLKCTTYSLKHILEEAQEIKVSSLNKNKQKDRNNVKS